MTANTLACPNCETTLTVSAAAPKVVTCPRCLYRLANPFGGQSETAAPAAAIPMKVLPLESQAAGDSGLIQTLLVVLVVLLALGAFVTAATIGMGNAAFGFLLVLLLMTFTAMAIVGGTRAQQRSKDASTAIETTSPPATAEELGILGYHNPYQREPTNALAAVGGFFAAIIVCGGGFFILAATVDMKSQAAGRGNRAFVLTLVVALVVGFMIAAPMLSSRKGWRGFGTGATIGLALGLLALGPCAFCYLLSLG